ncbi:MAG: FtsW/RodA/SpoVE family cell cycle protein [Lentisphaeria bacterium]|nr:FtsW/RodA/SpoVE family cell cycle protein [Lentisphaeria bacterium]
MPRPQPEITTAERLRAAGGFFANLDYIQLFAVLGLLGIGLIFIYSTGSAYGIRGTFAFYRQLQWIGLGGLLWLAGTLINYRSVDFRLLTIPTYLAVIVLLVLTLKFGTRVYGATRWIAIGSIRIQPSEFAKTCHGSAVVCGVFCAAF